MADTVEFQITPDNAERVDKINVQQQQSPAKTAKDWVRDMRMSAAVNKTTLGVESDSVTPEVLLATSSKLLKINRREAEADPKDSLEFQRVYGPAEYFSEHILKDANRLGRQLLWKATNRGNLDFVPTAALDQHISDVFNSSKMANMVDGSSPLETIEAAHKVSRIGEGGIADISSAPDEMRLVQPSFLGFIDPVRSVESLRVGLDSYLTKHCMKGSDGKLYQRFINARTGKEELVDSVTIAKSVVTTPEMMGAKTKYVTAVGGKTGVRIVKKSDVDYYLPRMDEAFTTASNLVTGMSGVKELRLLMGCLHPMTSVVTVSKRSMVDVVPAKDIGSSVYSVPGATAAGDSTLYEVRATYAKLPGNRNWFRKVVLYSGRTLITSKDHRWFVCRNRRWQLVDADKLRNGDKVLRSLFHDIPNRRTFIDDVLVTKDVALLLGYMTRTLERTSQDKHRICFCERHRERIDAALERLGVHGATEYKLNGRMYKAWADERLISWAEENVGSRWDTRRVPSVILSANAVIVAQFIDAFTADDTKAGIDGAGCSWILEIDNVRQRDGLNLLLNKLGVDSYYRDARLDNGRLSLAMKLIDMTADRGDCAIDMVKDVCLTKNPPYMVDIDINDNMYACANGIVTHNSKYPQQAVSIEGREAPLVRGLDEVSGKDIQSTIGRYLGARYAKKPGTVTAVRKDRVDMLYDDGTKGSIALYVNFPMNAKGYITNEPQVKAGTHVDKGGLIASSNYTDKDGTMATGTNLRTGWISWKGGTYEDAIVLSETAAKKLTSTTMYSSDMDLDKTITLGKRNYLSWKPGEYTKEQLSILDDDGIVRPGTVLQKGDPMVLAVQTTEPSPGTMGKRVLTDVSQAWEHNHPGVVTDIIRTRKGVKVLATVTAPLEEGDKVSGLYGNKGIVSHVLPDDQMPHDKDGKPLEMLLSPLGLVSRTNPAQMSEALLGKVAHKTGKYEVLPAFYPGDMKQYISDKLKQNHLTAEDSFFDPETGREIKGVLNGYSYIHKLKHLSESKMSARGTGAYSSDETPGGSGYEGSKRFGNLEISAMVGHGAFDNLLDAKLIRGQSNSEFWRELRTGGIPTIPGEPLVQRKWFAHLQGSGVNVRKTPKGISVFALSKGDVDQLAGPREVKTRDTYEARTFRPIDGGLFGQDVFGLNGDKWGYIQLDSPVPNPVMEEPLARLLRVSEKDFRAAAEGHGPEGMETATAIRDKLAKLDIAAEARQAMKEFKEAPASKKDAALKRYVAVERMRRQGVRPEDYMLDRIPVLPTQFRPVTTHNGLTMVADANYLYAQLLDARDDIREAKNLPKEYQDKAAANLYRTWQELVGMYDPEDVKLRNKNVGGLLQWALGKGAPKFSAAQRKLIGTSVDTVGRGVISPNARLTVDQVGVPINMAMDMMSPFVERALVNRGYSPIDAMKMVKKRDKQAMDVLQDVVKTHPVELNRAPTLHKFSIVAFEPVLVNGNAIQVHPSVCPGLGADFDGDTVNLHVPVSDAARKEAMDRMRPSRMLMTLSNHKSMFKPEKEYTQGLYIATRMGKTPDGRAVIFRTMQEARDAYKSGAIDIDTPIQILERGTDRK